MLGEGKIDDFERDFVCAEYLRVFRDTDDLDRSFGRSAAAIIGDKFESFSDGILGAEERARGACVERDVGVARKRVLRDAAPLRRDRCRGGGARRVASASS